jgi:sugar lactone lactonase YvrE
VAFTTGGLPNGATSANITGMTLSSPVGMTVTNPTAITPYYPVTPGSSFTVEFLGVTCTPGVAFSASGKLTYSVTTAAGPATYYATGTVAGTTSG